MTHITNSSLHDVLSNLNLNQGVLQNSTIQSLLQKLVSPSDSDETSAPSDSSQKKRKSEELERGQEELHNICKIQRMQRNRESAARSRTRKREYIEELELKLAVLSNQANESALLKERVARLDAENQCLRIQLEHFQILQQTPPQTPPSPQLQQQSPQPFALPEHLEEQSPSFVLNTPPESPEELSSHQFSKYATLEEFSLQLEKKIIPLILFWVPIWLTFLCGMQTEPREKRIPLFPTISSACWTSSTQIRQKDFFQAFFSEIFLRGVTSLFALSSRHKHYFPLPP